MSAPVVLLVEDDPDLADRLEHLLACSDFSVLKVHDGEKALNALRAGLVVSLVVLDLVMPNLDGWGLLAALRAQPELAAIPTIVITGDRTTDRSALRASASFLKPFPPQAFLDEATRLVTEHAR